MVTLNYNTDSIKNNLAAAYQICAIEKLDDLTYTHLSARAPGDDKFFIYPFGLMFEEVQADSLLKVTLDGEVLEGLESQYNQTGYVIHRSIYKARPDINAIFHIHSHAGIAVSAQKCGLLPISQFALHFYNKISYHNYNSLALSHKTHEDDLIKDLGHNMVMLLRNHGTITCGRNIEEAMFYTHHLEQACKAQCAAGHDIGDLIIPSHEICKKSEAEIIGFERDLGQRDWAAHLRRLDRLNIMYKTKTFAI